MYAVVIAVLFSLLVYYLFLGCGTMPEELPSAEATTRFLQDTKNLTTQEDAINTYVHVHKNARLLKNTAYTSTLEKKNLAGDIICRYT